MDHRVGIRKYDFATITRSVCPTIHVSNAPLGREVLDNQLMTSEFPQCEIDGGPPSSHHSKRSSRGWKGSLEAVIGGRSLTRER